ncbi:hypothetical protein Z948_3351 [Sulfitobacter donghicola DSW-25 = KCTC 12864 = JCM 14565]|nr:hypothetical protein Z948_3351 [Sulfitobacter donghicola DSW-25 = KCTC 12864 = JCM 14565]
MKRRKLSKADNTNELCHGRALLLPQRRSHGMIFQHSGLQIWPKPLT